MCWYDRSIGLEIAEKIKFGWVRLGLGVRVLSFNNFGNLRWSAETRYDDAFGEKWKGDLYHTLTIILLLHAMFGPQVKVVFIYLFVIYSGIFHQYIVLVSQETWLRPTYTTLY